VDPAPGDDFLVKEDIPQQDSNTQDIKNEDKKDQIDENIDIISQKLDFLVDVVNSNTGNAGAGLSDQGKTLADLKALVNDINSKIDNKIPTPKEDINFSHGISFLLLGVFLGIGVSFVMVNYQKLAHQKKSFD